MRSHLAWLSVMSVVLFASGCDALSPEWKKRLRDSLHVLLGDSTVSDPANQQPTAVTGPSGDPSGFSSEQAKAAKANAELLQEMFRVVFMREPRDRSEFGSYVDSLNQGASLEGVYNGFAHSADFRKLEMANMNASPDALKLFARELAILEAELPEMTPFTEKSAQPLATAVQVGVDPGEQEGGQKVGDGVNVVEFGKKEAPQGAMAQAASSPVPVDIKALTEKYTNLFIGASIYTLKRVLSDEALKVIAVKKEYKEKLALWYSKWAARTAGLGVDLGIQQRNSVDDQFHYRWALNAGEDRVSWEVLNRVHRLLNDANRQKQ